MMRTLTLLCLFAGATFAAETFTLTLKTGKKKSVTALRFDEAGLIVRQGSKEETIPWADMAPVSAFAARKALTPYDDGGKILELARFARRLLLFPQALEQLEIALALGGLDEAAFEKESQATKDEEVAHLTATIDTLVKAKAPAADCLRAIKRLKERYPEHEANRAYEGEIKRLVEQLALKAEAEQDDAEKQKLDKALAKLHSQISKENARKVKSLEKAEKLFAEADPAIALRQVSRVKRKLVEPSGAERYYKKARESLRKVVRLDPQALIIDKKAIQKEYDDIEKKLVECYIKVARILMKERNYKGAVEYVRKVLLYDPIHEEALEMVEEIRANRITFKLSDITNARPRVTGG